MARSATYSDVQGGLVVVARWKASAGNGEKVATILQEFLPHAQAESGVRLFLIGRDKEDADQFLFWEVFADEEASKTHQNSAHFQKLIAERALPLLADRQRTQYALI